MSSSEPRRNEGLEVAVARVGRSGGRARWAAIAWAAALVALVAVAIAERPTPSGPAPVAVQALGPHADPGPIASPGPRHGRAIRAAAPRERTPGEDGLMGSLVFDFGPDRPGMQSWPVGKLGWTTNPAQS